MPLFDLPLDQLREHRTSARKPDDLATFWADTLADARREAMPAALAPVDTGLSLVQTWDVTFSGFAGDPIRGWLHRPAGVTRPLPVVVHYPAYGGGRGPAHRVPLWPLAGYACLVMDLRGQGSGYLSGDTPDPSGSGPAHPGFLTRGIEDPATYYYRRVFTDAVRALDTVRSIEGCDPARVAVTGASQGGGIAVAAASLVPDVAAVLSDVPFLSDVRRGAELAAGAPYRELATYLAVHPDRVEHALATLAYFDISVLGALARAPALFSVGLMDETCPPSTVFAAYNAYGGPKQIRVYAFNDHEGGHAAHEAEQLDFLTL